MAATKSKRRSSSSSLSSRGRSSGGGSGKRGSGNRASGNRASGSRGRTASKSSARSSGSKVTWDHDEIRRWAEARGGEPACVKGTGGAGDEGVLRIDFPGYSGNESLQHIEWDEWFQKFDGAYLALVYQNSTKDGQKSNFNKLVSRSQAKAKARAGSRSGGGRSGGSSKGRNASTARRSKSGAGRRGR